MVVVKGRCAVSDPLIGDSAAVGSSPHATGPVSPPLRPPPRTAAPAGERRTGPVPGRSKSRPRKSLGQHFLTDSRVLGRIIAASDLSPDSIVLEVGPGRGALTRRLVRSAGRVIAVEMDDVLAEDLASRLDYPPNLVVAHADARTVDFPALIGCGVGADVPYRVVANLPYYAASPIIRRFLESDTKPELMVVMVQQEVAQSMLARPGKMSILSVATRFYAVPRLVCNVPPRAFRPAPKVASSAVRLDVRQRPAVDAASPDGFFAVVRAGFAAPRKQLRNSLSQGLGIAAADAGRILDAIGLDGRRRPETLNLEEWAAVYRCWDETFMAGGEQLGNHRSG